MADKMSFAAWLERELKEQNITQAELARRAGVTRGAINGILTGARGPGPDLIQAIARALKIPPEQVYRAAGMLPPAAETSEIIEQILYEIQDLPDDEKENIMEYIKMRREVAEKRRRLDGGR